MQLHKLKPPRPRDGDGRPEREWTDGNDRMLADLGILGPHKLNVYNRILYDEKLQVEYANCELCLYSDIRLKAGGYRDSVLGAAIPGQFEWSIPPRSLRPTHCPNSGCQGGCWRPLDTFEQIIEVEDMPNKMNYIGGPGAPNIFYVCPDCLKAYLREHARKAYSDYRFDDHGSGLLDRIRKEIVTERRKRAKKRNGEQRKAQAKSRKKEGPIPSRAQYLAL